MGQLSPDGKWSWDGTKWVAVASPIQPAGAGLFQQIPGLRTGAPWKLAIAGFAALLLIGAISSASQQPASTPTGHEAALVSSPSPAAKHSPTQSSSPLPSPSPSPSPRAVATSAPPPPAPAPPPADPYAAATAAGATAVCADGSWSFSKTRSGTCSGHGGVHWWTGNLGPAGPGAH
jgi:serine/threonine-protein kinase